MGSKTIVSCDFCKTEIKPGARKATLAVPKPSKKRTEQVEQYASIVSMFTFSGGEDVTVKKFDVCMGCALGLLALAGHERRELEQEPA
jgi:hypothetical protein